MVYSQPRLTIDTAEIPAGIRVYAIGDIHGRVDLLRRLHDRILDDSASSPPSTNNVAVYLGDYIDRGLHSREVIDVLLDEPLPGFESIHLRGNHDHELLAFLEDPTKSAAWLRYGGDATLYSYGVRVPSALASGGTGGAAARPAADALPPRHLAFLDRPAVHL